MKAKAVEKAVADSLEQSLQMLFAYCLAVRVLLARVLVLWCVMLIGVTTVLVDQARVVA